MLNYSTHKPTFSQYFIEFSCPAPLISINANQNCAQCCTALSEITMMV